MSVRLSVTSRCCIATAERIELIFEHRFYSFGLLYTELQEKSETAKIRVLPSETLSQTRNLEKFRYSATARQLSSFNRRLSPFYHTGRLSLCTTLWAWRSAAQHRGAWVRSCQLRSDSNGLSSIRNTRVPGNEHESNCHGVSLGRFWEYNNFHLCIGL